MTKKRLRKLYNACMTKFYIYCREDLGPGEDFLRPMYDNDIKTVYYSFETWYNKVRQKKSGEMLTNEDIYYEHLYHWHENRTNKLESGFWGYVDRRFPD